MATTAIPVRTLRELITALEAAITLALANPTPRSVHRLRTTTRRIEAQLELLALLPDLPGQILPDHAKLAKKTRKLLRKLRRAAGRVRDLDVQHDLAKTRSPRLREEAHRLRDLLGRRCDEEVERLLHLLRKREARLTRTLEALMEALEPAESLTLSLPQLTRLTLLWHTRHTPASMNGSRRQLHALRRNAKIARYMIESGLPAATSGKGNGLVRTRRLAGEFESLQQSGGSWHDWLTLSEIARRELGSSSGLAQSFTRRRERSLADYLRRLKANPAS